MDDLLVILITILIAVVGVLNQRKKKKDAQQPVSESAGQPADFWEMLMQQQEQRPVYNEVEEDEIDDEVIDTVPEPKPVYQFKAAEEGSSDLVEEKKILQRQKKKPVLIDGEEFSIRKAIIYNEILNRKYT